MVHLVNPFLGYKNPDKGKSHNPYKFNPFSVLSITKDEVDPEIVIDKIKELEFEINPERSSNLSEDDQQQLRNFSNAQRFLELPLQRLAFEILILDNLEDKIKGEIP